MGELSPIGSISSILVFGSSTNATATPCSGRELDLSDRCPEDGAVALAGGREIGHGDRNVVQASEHGPVYTFVTNTVTIGFLPHTSFAAARTARRTASRTVSRSLRRGRGMLSTAPTAAS